MQVEISERSGISHIGTIPEMRFRVVRGVRCSLSAHLVLSKNLGLPVPFYSPPSIPGTIIYAVRVIVLSLQRWMRFQDGG